MCDHDSMEIWRKSDQDKHRPFHLHPFSPQIYISRLVFRVYKYCSWVRVTWRFVHPMQVIWPTIVLLYRTTFEIINSLREKQYHPHTRTTLLNVSDFLSSLKISRAFNGFVCIYNSKQHHATTRAPALYANVTSEGNITSGGKPCTWRNVAHRVTCSGPIKFHS